MIRQLLKTRGIEDPIGKIVTVLSANGRRLRVKTAQGWKWMKTDRAEARITGTLVPKEPKLVKQVLVLKQGQRKGQQVVRYVPKPKPKTYYSPMAVKRAGIRLAGWTDMTHSPTPKQWAVMFKLGTARLVSGKPAKGRQWHARNESVIVPWQPDAKHIEVNMWQYRPVKKRVHATAIVHLVVDYPYARKFIESWITSAEYRNRYLGELERSAGFQAFKRTQLNG